MNIRKNLKSFLSFNRLTYIKYLHENTYMKLIQNGGSCFY